MNQILEKIAVFSLFVFILLCHSLANTDNEIMTFKQLSLEEGLPGVNVRSVFQDSYGYMWFGIESAGLCKYDGKRFNTYNTDTKDSNSISNSYINSIIEDENGDLWLATENGLNIFNRQKEIFNKYFYPEISHNNINSIYKDKENGIWIGTFSGFMRFKPVTGIQGNDSLIFGFSDKNNKYVRDHDFVIDEISNQDINCIYEDNENLFWFGTTNGAYNYNFNTHQLNLCKAESIDDVNPSINKIHNISQLYNSYYLFCSEGGLVLFEKSSGAYNILTFQQSGIVQEAQVAINLTLTDRNGVMWIGTTSHGLITGESNNLPENISIKINTPNAVKGILSPNIKGIYEDNTGQIWIITKFAGIFKYDKRSQLFPHYKIGDKEDNFIISAFERRNGNILLGSKYSGLFEFNRTQSSFSQKTCFINDHVERRIECIFEDKEGYLWIGLQEGVVKMDSLKNVLSHYKHEKVWTFLEDRLGTLWLGSIKGILVLNRKKNQLERKKDIPSDHILNNPDISVRAMMEDSNGNIWIGTDHNGIYRYNIMTHKTDSFRYEPGNNASLSGNTIRSIFEDSRGTIWIGTKSTGLNCFLDNSEGFQHFTTSEGLPSNSIFDIIEDNKGNLWFTTNNGISNYDIQNRNFSNFNTNHGLQGNVIEQRTTIKLKNGDILFGGSNGFNIFSPVTVQLDSYSPPLVVSKIEANGQTIKKDVFLNEEVIIPYQNSNLITFEFASLDFRDPSSIEYAYQLVGVDDDWIYSGQRNIVTYTGLSHGKYNFTFNATNADGIWADNELNLKFVIQTPFWLKWWAFIIYFLSIVIFLRLVYGFITIKANYNHKSHSKEIELKKNKELNMMKLQFFTNISHELRTPLSLIITPLQELLNSDELGHVFKQKIKLVEGSARRLMRLTDQLLYFRKVQAANLKLELVHGDIIKFISEIITPFYKLADNYNVQLEFKSHYNKLLIWFDPDKVEKIISNLLSNALKFTPKFGIIKVQMLEIESFVSAHKMYFTFKKRRAFNYINISVSDSGIGITDKKLEHIFNRFYQAEPFNTGVGIGLELVKQLVDMHKGKIKVNSSPGKGTTFSVYLPVNKYLYRNEIFADREINSIEYVKKVEPEILYSREKEELLSPDVPGEENLEKPLLLLVEDNPDFSSYLSQMLAGKYRVIIAGNGKAGLELVNTKSPDMIITDLMMPVMSGLEFCKEVKTNIQTSHIPVIILTAKGLEEDQLQGLEAGADDYITKPFSVELLKIRVKNLIDSRRKIHNRFSKSLEIHPEEITTSKVDEKFVEDFLRIINENIANPDLSITDISRQLNMDRTNLYKKIKSLIGKSPSQIIREYRIKKAAGLLLTNNYNINEISYMTGFTSHAYFTKLFHKTMGKTPSDFIRKNMSKLKIQT